MRAGFNKLVVSRQLLSRRVIALATAYAIALSGVIASFGAALVAAEAAAQPSILCHNSIADRSTPSPGGTSGKVCADNCCAGCLAMPGTLPPPTAVAAAPQSGTKRVATLTSFILVLTADSHYHRSRAPPAAA